MLEMFIIQHISIWPNFILIGFRIQNELRLSVNFHHVAMLMMTSQTLKSVDITKAQKSRNLENETLFLLQIKKIITCASRATL